MCTSSYYVTYHDSIQLVNYKLHYMMFFPISFITHLQNFTFYMLLKRTYGQTKIIIYTVLKHSKIWFQNSSLFAQSLTIVSEVCLFLALPLWFLWHGGHSWCNQLVVMQRTIALWLHIFAVLHTLSLKYIRCDKLIQSYHDGAKLVSTTI